MTHRLPQGPSANELKLRSEVDKLRRELSKLKKAAAGAAAAAPVEAPAAPAPHEVGARANDVTTLAEEATTHAPAARAPEAAASGHEELEALRREVAELTETRQRLSRLYFAQVEENRKRARKLHEILENIGHINSSLDLDSLLERAAETLRESLGFRIVLIRVREPGTSKLQARAFAGLDAGARARLEQEDIEVETFLSWLRDEFKVGRSYFISHSSAFNRKLPAGYTPDLGPREEWEWHGDDVLLVPMFNRAHELIGYFSVDDPVDRLVPSTETIELLEIFGNHAVVAIENARLYAELAGQTRELKEAGRRMEEMHALRSNFVSTVSHELRTPLTAIRAYLDTLLSMPGGDIPRDQLLRFLGTINDESQRLARLIESVLDLNRFDAGLVRGERLRLDLAGIAAEALRMLEPVAETGQITLKAEVTGADTAVEADRDQMRQLVLHLAGNAVKFTPSGGTVTVRLSGDPKEVVLQVVDTGIGIPGGELDKVFERFYQVDSSLVRRYGGTGLGLAICKSIVEWHGGRIFAESTPGRGSCFTVVLPRRVGSRAVARPAPESRSTPNDLMKLAVEMVADVMNARVVSLLVPGPGGDLVVRAAIGLDEKVVREARVRPGTGVAGWVAEHRKPVCVSGGDAAGEVAGSGRVNYRTGTFLSVPLEGHDGLVGVLNVTDPVTEDPFEVEDCHLLLNLADRVVAVCEQAGRMESSQSGVEGTAYALRQVLHQLERGRRQAPGRMKLARALAREVGMLEHEVGVVRFAAGIHDVGMGPVSGELAERPGELTEHELEQMRRHVEIGADLLRPIEDAGAVREIVRAHHEWWDGSGYPRGLEGEEIPLGARILAVVDAWESITVGRAHRPARSREEALQEIRALAGRQFDPDVVAAFERVLARGDEAVEAAPPGTQDATADARR